MKMVERLAHWDVAIYHTDTWGTYAAVLPPRQAGAEQNGRGAY
jgi:hypothetical protein